MHATEQIHVKCPIQIAHLSSSRTFLKSLIFYKNSLEKIPNISSLTLQYYVAYSLEFTKYCITMCFFSVMQRADQIRKK